MVMESKTTRFIGSVIGAPRKMGLGRPVVFFLFLVLVLGSVWASADAEDTTKWATKLIPGSYFCDGRGTPAEGAGSSSQERVHADVFGPDYRKYCLDSDATITFRATGHNDGVNGLLFRDRDFAFTDIPLTLVQKTMIEKDLQQVRNRQADVHQIPLYVDALAIGFNLPCLPSDQTLRLTSFNLSNIFSGRIKYWNDQRLILDNPALAGCPDPIALAKRDSFNGSTMILKDYLSKRNPEWNYYKQSGQNTTWPPGASFACSAVTEINMASCINNTLGSIGYIQYKIASDYRVRMAALDHVTSIAYCGYQWACSFSQPSPESCRATANTVVTTASLEDFDIFDIFPFGTAGDWSTVSLTDAPAMYVDSQGKTRAGYPICNLGYAFTFGQWVAAYGGDRSTGNIRSVIDYLWVATTDGTQAKLLERGYAPLPPVLLNVARQGINAIRVY